MEQADQEPIDEEGDITSEEEEEEAETVQEDMLVKLPLLKLLEGQSSLELFKGPGDESVASALDNLGTIEHSLKPINYVGDHRLLPSNNFYTPLLFNPEMPVYVNPYTVWYSKSGANRPPSFSIQQVDEKKMVLGSVDNTKGNTFFFSPFKVEDFFLSAREFDSSCKIQVHDAGQFSVQVTIKCKRGSLTIPIVQGMAYVTAIYEGNLTPTINTAMRTFRLRDPNKSTTKTPNGCNEMQLSLNSGDDWNVYVCSEEDVNLRLRNDFLIETDKKAKRVVVQLAKIPTDKGNSQVIYARHAGNYVEALKLFGIAKDTKYEYGFDPSIKQAPGKIRDKSALHFFYPHQAESYVKTSTAIQYSLKMQSPTHGKMTAYSLSGKFTMSEKSNPLITWIPWGNKDKSYLYLRKRTRSKLKFVANKEINDLDPKIFDHPSQYFTGKSFGKYAFILLTSKLVLKNTRLTKTLLDKMKKGMKFWLDNAHVYPWVYDKTWGGIISQEGLKDPGLNFGASYYNDHHFHYGYYIHAAAAIAYVDKLLGGKWGEENREWVDLLVKDTANMDERSQKFPFSRSFSWYLGHSWAKGISQPIFNDGKDEESSSEDVHFAYGLKLWGAVSGNNELACRGDLMLSVMRDSMNSYYLYKKSNNVQPSGFIHNKVAGILFENKVDHTTWFGNKPEYIQGIHMLPLTPASTLIRQEDFVNEEWSAYFDKTDPFSIGGWGSILMENYALVKPKGSYKFFSQPHSENALDGGTSRTWGLAFAALLGGSPKAKFK